MKVGKMANIIEELGGHKTEDNSRKTIEAQVASATRMQSKDKKSGLYLPGFGAVKELGTAISSMFRGVNPETIQKYRTFDLKKLTPNHLKGMLATEFTVTGSTENDSEDEDAYQHRGLVALLKRRFNSQREKVYAFYEQHKEKSVDSETRIKFEQLQERAETTYVFVKLFQSMEDPNTYIDLAKGAVEDLKKVYNFYKEFKNLTPEIKALGVRVSILLFLAIVIPATQTFCSEQIAITPVPTTVDSGNEVDTSDQAPEADPTSVAELPDGPREAETVEPVQPETDTENSQNSEATSTAIPTAEVYGTINAQHGTSFNEQNAISVALEGGAVSYVQSGDMIYVVTRDPNTGVTNATALNANLITNNGDGSYTATNKDGQTVAKIYPGETRIEITPESPTGPVMPSLEELTVDNAPNILSAEQITGQTGFVQEIITKTPEAQGRIVVLDVEKLGAGDASRGIDSANMVVYGMDNGVVLAVHNIETNRLEHAVGGNKIDLNGQEVTLPFMIYAINDQSMLDQYGQIETYQYGQGNPNIPDIVTAQKSIVKGLLTALVLEQEKNSYGLSNTEVYQLNNEQRDTLINQMIQQYLAKFANRETFRVKGVEVGPSTKAFIFNMNYMFRRFEAGSQFAHTGSEGGAFSVSLTSELWGSNTGFESFLGGELTGILRTKFVNPDWYGFTDQDSQIDTGQTVNHDLTYFIATALSNMSRQQLLEKMLRDNPGSDWTLTGLPVTLKNPGNDNQVDNSLMISTDNYAIRIR